MKVIVICGPTGSGKSDLAFDLAQRLSCEIISFDSIQVYRELKIGSAKPSDEMLLKVKHHLINHCDLTQEYTAGDFRKDALEILKNQKKSHCILVGGTGFYLNALLKGMFEIPKISQVIKDQVQLEIKSIGNLGAFEKLKEKDPAYAARIHVNDSYRIARGLEIIYGLGKKPSSVSNEFEKTPFGYETVKFAVKISRDDLRKRITLRTQKMLEQGFIEEVIELRKDYPNAKALLSVGYKEICHYLDGFGTLKDLEEKIIISTMQLAKRQVTWFKRDSEIQWVEPSSFIQIEKI